MNIRMKWYYLLGFLLLLLVVLFVFWKLNPLWFPVFSMIIKVLIPFVIAAFITYLLHPIVEKLHAQGFHRGLAVLIIYILFFGGLGLSLYKAVPTFIHQLKDLSENIPAISEQYRIGILWLQEKTETWPDGIQMKMTDGINRAEIYLDHLLSRTIESIIQIINYIFLFAIIPFIAFYMLKDFDLLKKATWYLTPRKWRKKGMAFLHDVDQSLGGYIRGQLIVCVFIGTISALLLWLVKVKYSLLLGVIIGLTNVIPYFGPIIGAIPAIMVAATISVKKVIYVAIIVMILQFLEGNILSPYIVGKSLHMHPLIIMLALMLGGEIGGLIGLIIAVPVFAIIKVALLHARIHFIHSKQTINPAISNKKNDL